MRKLIFLYCLLYCTTAISQDFPAAMEALGVLQSVYEDANPVISADGKTIYFSRKGHPQNMGEEDQYDIWMAFRQNDDTWGKAVNMPAPLNNKKDNFVVATSTDGLTLFLNDGYTSSKSGLVYTRKKGRSWSKPLPVQIRNFQPNGQTRFSLSDDSKALFLTENSADGYGGRDIYISTQIDKHTWSQPTNLGSVVNSTREEFHAVLAADNKTLYFLSNGFSNPTMLTVMVSHRNGADWKEWTAPQSTGIELDPRHFNTNFSIDPGGAYLYCSGNVVAQEDQQLYRIPIPDKHRSQPTAFIVGELIDVASGASLDGQIKVSPLSVNGKSRNQNTNRGGRFQMILPYQEQFSLSAEVPGYFAKSEIIGNHSFQELDKEANPQNNKNGFIRSPQADQLQVRLQQLHKSMNELDQQRKSIKLTTDSRPRTRKIPKGSDAQLEALKYKYQKAIGMETHAAEASSSSGDSELDAMKRAFRKHNDVREEEFNSKSPKSTARTDETQLEAMKRKYNEANNNTSSEQADEYIEEAVVLSAVAVPYSFTQLVDQSREDLEKELSERVAKELRADLLQEVSFEMHSKMDAAARDQYAGTLQRKTGALESEVRKELRKKYRKQVKRELKGELLEVVEEELRLLLREEVKQELRESLKEEVRNELRLELEYLLTKEMATDVQRELNLLVKQLRKEKDKDTEPAPASYYQEKIQSKGALVKKGQQNIHLQLYPIKTGSIIPLENIFFEANSATWKESALPELERVFKLLLDNPKLKIELGGHTNGWCSTAFAQELSGSRAKAIAEFLIERGIDAQRIQWQGYGKSQPLVPNDSIENCKKNQRLELKIL